LTSLALLVQLAYSNQTGRRNQVAEFTVKKQSVEVPMSNELIVDMIVGWIVNMGWESLPLHWKKFYWQHGGWREGKSGPRQRLP
jgi:hypothetical protein